ncbi:PilN domain-containing protein [Bradyrhizobium sp. LTSP849]|uniref:PilN domain-containing protein n=1 Tax=Bradyrhizobium sp. LTSP849 TaxID=1615890 RepID=UPI000AC81122|nr:PilN domain-containing protein [Bradyrhizobium sp. LTSP849]
MKQVVDIVGFELGVRVCGVLSAAIRWWINELVQSIPSSIRLKLSARHDKRYVRVHGEQVEITDSNFRTGSWKLLPCPEDVRQSTPDPVALLLPAAMVLRRVIELPIAAKATLHETASFQIGRVTPFKPGEVHYVARTLAQDRLKKTIRAEIAVTPREALKRALESISSYGLQPTAIFVEGDTSQPAFDYLPQIGANVTPQTQSLTRWAIVVGACLLISAPFLAAFRLHLLAEKARNQVALAAKIAAKASDSQTKLDTLISSESFLPDRLRGPHSLEVLDGLSRQIPDTSWVFRLEIRADNAIMSGLSSDLPALLQQLARPPFSTPELTSPVVQGIAGGPARFELRVRYGSGQ